MPRPSPRILLASALAVIAALVTGCSDDVVCPDIDPVEALPYISAAVIERGGAADSTHATVVCTADPLPVFLVAFVNARELDDVGSVGELGLAANLSDDIVVWQPGTLCSLEVTTDFGFATAGATVPEGPVVTTPAAIATSDSLVLTWPPADDADYYVVVASIPGGDQGFTMTTRETTAVLASSAISAPGTLSGWVASVAGPFPQGGTEGNISGTGWGFFTASYFDDAGAFTVEVSD